MGSNDHIRAVSYSLKELCEEAYENKYIVKKIIDKARIDGETSIRKKIIQYMAAS